MNTIIEKKQRTRQYRLPKAAHTSQPWRIQEIAPDFQLEDVWALPTPGGRDDFRKLVQTFSQPARMSFLAESLMTLRWKFGALFGWDNPGAGIGSRVHTLRERLPTDLLEASPMPDNPAIPFKSVYLTNNEWAREIANSTVHAVMHIGWVADGRGGYRGQMAVLVKPNGLFGKIYMAIIKPFRYLFVYPSLIQSIKRRWQALKVTDAG